MTIVRRAGSRLAAVASLSVALGACSTLPTTGPTRLQIYRAGENAAPAQGFKIVDLDTADALPPPRTLVLSAGEALSPGQVRPTNLMGPGDILDVTLYEAGVSLFSSGDAGLGAGGADVAAKRQNFPPIRVDDDGYVTLPYAGRLKAAGHTTTELQRAIERALAGRSENPQVIVALQQSITNSIIVYGEVANPGRQVLATPKESLLDAIALAGGYRGGTADLVVRLERKGQTLAIRLNDLQNTDPDSIQVFPGDRIALLRQPRSFAAMGASGKVAEFPFVKSSISLAEAIAQAGGVADTRGDPKAIFVFRFVKKGDGSEEPTVYHINMMNARAYFLAQKFVMQDQDVLYIGNAAANQPTKFLRIISEFFTPIVAARSVTR